MTEDPKDKPNELSQREKFDKRVTNLIQYAPAPSVVTLKLYITDKGQLNSWIVKDVEEMED